jgi:N-acetylmuramic acid 6-phosphate etherase
MADRQSSLDELATEAWDAAGADLDLRTTVELVELMNAEDSAVPAAVGDARDAIAAAVEAVASSLRRGGRLIYVGAGTSGRLAAVDAAECESTFSMPPGQVLALVAGGALSSAPEQEAAEDDEAAGAAELDACAVSARDVVVGVSASGRTPYVLGALTAARRAGARTVGVVNVPGSALAELVDHEIAVIVGAEVVAGSTRLKAGTAQKLILNTISTVAMIRIGKTFGNLMVDVDATNDKLRARVRRIVQQATGASSEEVEAALAASDGQAKVAIVALLTGTDAATAGDLLAQADGVVRKALAR